MYARSVCVVTMVFSPSRVLFSGIKWCNDRGWGTAGRSGYRARGRQKWGASIYMCFHLRQIKFSVLNLNFPVPSLTSQSCAAHRWGSPTPLEHCFLLPTFLSRVSVKRNNGWIKTAQQRTIIQQYCNLYTGRWWVGCYIWYSEKGPAGQAAAPPSPLLPVQNV